MTVKELIRSLKSLGPKEQDRLVVCSRDPEGNGYSELHQISTAAYKGDDWGRGEIGLEPHELTDEARALGYSESDVMEGGKRAVVLWPS